MKDALHRELDVQRGAHLHLQGSALRAGEAETLSRLHSEQSPSQPGGSTSDRSVARGEMLAWTGSHMRPSRRFQPGFEVAAIAGRLSRHHLREAERIARQRRFHGDEDELDQRRGRHR